MTTLTDLLSTNLTSFFREQAHFYYLNQTFLPALMKRKREVIKGFADYRIEGLETFDLFAGEAHFLNENELAVGDVVLRAKTFVIATGSTTVVPHFPGLVENGYIDSDQTVIARRICEGEHLVPDRPFARREIGGGNKYAKRK